MTVLVSRSVTNSGTDRLSHRRLRKGLGWMPFVTTTQDIGRSVKASRRARASAGEIVAR